MEKDSKGDCSGGQQMESGGRKKRTHFQSEPVASKSGSGSVKSDLTVFVLNQYLQYTGNDTLHDC